jgi:hypothetical protein
MKLANSGLGIPSTTTSLLPDPTMAKCLYGRSRRDFRYNPVPKSQQMLHHSASWPATRGMRRGSPPYKRMANPPKGKLDRSSSILQPKISLPLRPATTQ